VERLRTWLRGIDSRGRNPTRVKRRVVGEGWQNGAGFGIAGSKWTSLAPRSPVLQYLLFLIFILYAQG
jgi:hypothetical protein